ncbi:hypothetical protein KCMC57_up34980 [Kitasatospora sp. CMC57]
MPVHLALEPAELPRTEEQAHHDRQQGDHGAAEPSRSQEKPVHTHHGNHPYTHPRHQGPRTGRQVIEAVLMCDAGSAPREVQPVADGEAAGMRSGPFR